MFVHILFSRFLLLPQPQMEKKLAEIHYGLHVVCTTRLMGQKLGTQRVDQEKEKQNKRKTVETKPLGPELKIFELGVRWRSYTLKTKN